MSVAFRREGDDEHLEPKFELPIPPGPNLVTERGLIQIADKLAALTSTLEILEDEADIKAQRRVLRYWGTRQATAQVQPIPTEDRVAFGVTLTCLLHGKTRVFTIVGDDEADAPAGLVSWSSPLARAVMNAEPGDLIDFGGKTEAIEIVAIDVLDGCDKT